MVVSRTEPKFRISPLPWEGSEGGGVYHGFQNLGKNIMQKEGEKKLKGKYVNTYTQSCVFSYLRAIISRLRMPYVTSFNSLLIFIQSQSLRQSYFWQLQNFTNVLLNVLFGWNQHGGSPLSPECASALCPPADDNQLILPKQIFFTKLLVFFYCIGIQTFVNI